MTDVRSWGNAPITKTALWDSPSVQGPSGLEREWSGLLKHEGDYILLIASCWRRPRATGTNQSFTALWWNVSEEAGDPDSQRAAAVLSTPAANVERLLTPFCREVRVRIMQELYRGAKLPENLSAAVNLTGGALFSHLDELMQAALVRKEPDGAYSLTPLGCNLLLVVTSLAGVTVEDRGADGLVIGAIK